MLSAFLPFWPWPGFAPPLVSGARTFVPPASSGLKEDSRNEGRMDEGRMDEGRMDEGRMNGREEGRIPRKDAKE